MLENDHIREQQLRTQRLVGLYGEGVLPPDLVRVRNGNLSVMEHLGAAGDCEMQCRKEMFDILLRLVWLVEEKPVVTRFFCLLHVASPFYGCFYWACRLSSSIGTTRHWLLAAAPG